MKKILLATTLLAASAGFASAEISFSGEGKMGIANSATNSKAAFYQRLRISANASAESDNGLSFGGSMRLDQDGGNTAGGFANGDSTVFVSGAFGKLTMGDVSGAADALVGQTSGVGLTGLGDMNEIGFLGNATTGALYVYSAGQLSFALGAGQTTAAAAGSSVAVKYDGGAYTAALGYERRGAAHQTSFLGSATFSGFTAKVKLADKTGAAKMAYSLSGDYTMSGVAVTAFYSNNYDFAGADAYGLGGSYDLGGGASVKGGVAKAKGAKTRFDLGVKMAF